MFYMAYFRQLILHMYFQIHFNVLQFMDLQFILGLMR